jgi:hypothetical protein
LNIDVASMFGKLNMMVPIIEMWNIPSVKREILKLLKVPTDKEYPLIILNIMYLDRQKYKNPPFYLSLDMNDLCLQNYMLDFGASVNAISLKLIKQIGLKKNPTLW